MKNQKSYMNLIRNDQGLGPGVTYEMIFKRKGQSLEDLT